VMSQDIVDS